MDRGTSASADMTSLVLYLALYQTFDWILTLKRVPRLVGEIVALAASSCIALKSTAVPYVVFLVLLAYAAFIWRQTDKGMAVGDALGAIAGTGLLLAPWMIEMYLSAHTFLHPFLGEGYFGSTYGTFPKWSHFTQPSDLLNDRWLIIVAALAAIYFCAFKLTTEERAAALCVSTATIGGCAILWATAGTVRYSALLQWPPFSSWPQTLPATSSAPLRRSCGDEVNEGNAHRIGALRHRSGCVVYIRHLAGGPVCASSGWRNLPIFWRE